MSFTAGAVVSFRKRNWLVEPNPNSKKLKLKPLGTFGDESIELDPVLIEELGKSFPEEIPTSSQFPEPDADAFSDEENLKITFQAFRLLLRDGTAPFRSFGKIAISPRIYQLVPLVLSLKQTVIRLLIADDVGVGKTIEAGLIARELLDRNVIDRLVVLCPPSLCDQWQVELNQKFQINAEVVRSSSLTRLERNLPIGEENLFRYFPYLVVSIDLMKSERYKSLFLSSCADFVIVDEVHTMARPSGSSPGKSAHLRYELLKSLSSKAERHMVLLSATPHNGYSDSFLSILGLLNPKFESFDLEKLSNQEREILAKHFIQRRRPDIIKWLGEDTPFPKRDESELELAYSFSKEGKSLFQEVLTYAREIVKKADGEKKQHRRRMQFYSALALLRSISSSPAQAALAFDSKIQRSEKQASSEAGDEEEGSLDKAYAILDSENAADDTGSFVVDSLVERKHLESFREKAMALFGEKDTKLQEVKRITKKLLEEGKSPIIWCRFIQTAEYLGKELGTLKVGKVKPQIAVVTGRISDEERKEKVKELGNFTPRVLVATDCLSEGINLQDHFNAIIHYDLPWNPNRMEQREGRVDRFGQKAKEIPIHIIYGKDNPMDGAILQVLIRKSRAIRSQLGIQVPIPIDSDGMLETVMHSFLLKTDLGDNKQMLLFDEADPAFRAQKQFELMMENAVQKEKESRSRFAHHADHPGSLESELQLQKAETDRIFGTPKEAEDFFFSYFKKANLPITKKQNGIYEVKTDNLPKIEDDVRLNSAGDKVKFSFFSPEPEGTIYLGRTSPILTKLAEKVIEKAMHPNLEKTFRLGSRLSVVRSKSVKERWMVNLYRFRFEKSGKLSEEPYFLVIKGVGDKQELIFPPESEKLFQGLEITGNGGTSIEVSTFLRRALESEKKIRPLLLDKRKERTVELNQRYQSHKDSLRLSKGEWKEVGEIELFGSLVVFPE
ncbi:MAG: DEAD/DEAH box helicase [Leptospira sp.]|nr:DEAD/DEAH box helicase [Leptospira sp.]